jgi:hypothetical protein
MTKLKQNDVVQFNENHKWCGALGIVSEIKELENDTKYLIGVPIPEATNVSTAYIFVMASDMALERIGVAELGESVRSENENRF